MSPCIHGPNDPRKCGHPDCTGTPDSYVPFKTKTISTQKVFANKLVSRRGITIAGYIAARRLKRYLNKTGYQLCSTPEFVIYDDYPHNKQYVHVYGRAIPKGYLPENTILEGSSVTVFIKGDML